MTNKELNALVALKMNLPKTETKYLQNAFTESIKNCLTETNIINFESFGYFEINKVVEKEIFSPKSKERKIIPPQLIVLFKQSNILKDKLNLKTKKA